VVKAQSGMPVYNPAVFGGVIVDSDALALAKLR
jgi:hypothetical protein